MYPSKKSARKIPALRLLGISIGIIYCWFGALKFFHGFSPAEQLAINTIDRLTFQLLPNQTSILLLAAWETLLGIWFIVRKPGKTALVFMFVHMACTFTPLFFFPGESFRHLPYGFSLLGQYIMKNIVIVSAGIVLWQDASLQEEAGHAAETNPSLEENTPVPVRNFP